MKNQAGFTLMEVLVYLGLFALLLGGAFTAAYNLVESAGRNRTAAMVVEEGNFLLGKITWALGGVQAINQPPANTNGSILAVTKDAIPVTIDLDTVSVTNIRLRRDTTENFLNNANVRVSNLNFDHQSQNGSEWVTAKFTLNATTPEGRQISQDFQTTKYLRK